MNVNNVEILIEFKFDLIKLITDYEHFVQLNLPIVHAIDAFNNLVQSFR